MLKFKGNVKGGRMMIGLVLEPEDIVRMAKSEMVILKMEPFGFEGVDITIGIADKKEFLKHMKGKKITLIDEGGA